MGPSNLTFLKLFGTRSRVKIIKVLASEKELNITQIIKKTKSTHKSVSKQLGTLTEMNLVQEKKIGRIRIYRFQKENPIVRGIINFIKLIEGE